MMPEWFAVVLVAATVGLAGILVAGAAYALAAARRSLSGGPVASLAGGRQGPHATDLANAAGGAAAVLVAWAGLSLILAGHGAFASRATTTFPWIGVGIALPVGLGLGVMAASPGIRRLVDAVPAAGLIGVQFYRVLGVLFLVAYAEHRMPGPFALPAGIGDVAVGLAAPLVAYALAKGFRSARALGVAWNIAGIADLVLAVSMGFSTSPSAFEWLAKGSPNLLITRWPFVLIPVFAVPASILLHAAALRRLRRPATAAALAQPTRSGRLAQRLSA